VRFRELDQCRAQRPKARRQCVDRIAQPQPQVGRDLVVARACRVQLFAGIADQCHEPLLDREMHVLVFAAPREFASLDLAPDGGETALDGGEICGRQHVHACQHACVRERARDVHQPEPAIEIDRGVETLHALGERFAEATRPRRSLGSGSALLVAGLVSGHYLPRRRLFPTIAGRKRWAVAA
jgi:hypothetical protein